MEESRDFLALVLVLMVFGVVAVWLLSRLARRWQILFTTVFDWEYGLSYLDGIFEGVLPSGRHWNPLLHRRDVYRLSRGDQLLKTPPIDVTSSDGLFFRLSATITYNYVDPRMAFENRHEEKLQLAAASALIKLAGGHALETFFTNRAALDASLLAAMPGPITGCRITGVVLDGVVLPPELRRLFSEGERARIEGTTALERARSEHAALRSLANAARLLKGNPELMNLRVLQALSNTGRGQPTFVLGQNALVPIASGASGPEPEPA